MTTPSTERKAGPLLGTGSQTTWPFTFKVFAATDIAVTIADSLGVETQLTYGVDYTVSLNANQETSPGGTVTYPISGAALPVGKRLVIFGNLPYDQPLDLPSGGNFSPLAIENQLDRTVMQIQQLRENVGRALQLPVTASGTLSVQLPQPSPDDLIGWDTSGNNLANYALSEIATAIGYGNFRYDTFTGDGVTTQFTLSVNPATLGNLDVSIAGVVQVPVTDYTLATGKLVFSSAPPNGAVVLARYGEAIPSLPGSEQISFVQSGIGAATRTVESKLRETVSVKDFGAVGNNSTDDTAAIQAALNAMTNGSALSFVGGATYRVTAPIVVPPNLTGCVFLGNGATIRADHNGDGLVMIATNQNYSRHKVYDLTIRGPNVSYPNNPSQLAGTSTGAALKMGYDDTSNTVPGYLTSFYNCTFTNFYQGVYLQATILVNFYGGYISFNQFGVYVDGGQTNANTFYGVGIRENRQFGIYSSGRTGGSLSNATHNVFHSCEIETNIPYDSSAGGYPATFNAGSGHGIKLWNSYDWIFDSCYIENHNYSVLLDGSSDDNRWKSCRFDGGGSGGVRPGSVVIGGTGCNNNVFTDCKMVDYVGYAEGTFQNLSSSNLYNQLIDCIGFSFNPANILAWPHIRNHRKSQGTAGNGQAFGAIVVPPQGLRTASAGTEITGVGTTSASINAFGLSEVLLSSAITGATTITSIANMRPGQLLVINNYQIAHPVTIQASTDGINGIVLSGRSDVVLSGYSDSITFYCTSIGKVVEVGRSLVDGNMSYGTWTPSFVRSGGSTPAQTAVGRWARNGRVVELWFEVSFSAGPFTDAYYDTATPFQNARTFVSVGTAASGGVFNVDAITLTRLRCYVTSSTNGFTGRATLLLV